MWFEAKKCSRLVQIMGLGGIMGGWEDGGICVSSRWMIRVRLHGGGYEDWWEG